jgi:hypothetical protein
MQNKSYTHICIEILQINKFNNYIILLYDTMHYKDNIIYKYHIHNTKI